MPPRQVAILMASPARAHALRRLFTMRERDDHLLPPDPAGAFAFTRPRAEVSVVSTVAQLSTLLEGKRVDVVVLEDDLGGFFGGIDVMERIHRDVLRPYTVLLARQCPTLRQRLRKIGVDRLLPLDAAPDHVKTAVDGLFLPNVGVADIPQRATRLTGDAVHLSPLPQLMAKLAHRMVEPDLLDVPELARDISSDPRLTATLLKLANSPSIGIRHHVNRVVDAVTLLGLDRTISLILSATLVDSLKQTAKLIPNATRLWYYKRGVLTACAAYAIARHLGTVSADTAFVLGLYQEVGVLGLAVALGDRYGRTLQRVRSTGHLRLEAVEATQYGITHADVGAAMLRAWGVPEPLVRQVLEHHQTPAIDTDSLSQREFKHVLLAAEAFANLLDGHYSQRYPQLLLALSRFDTGSGGGQSLAALREAVTMAIDAFELFRVPCPDPDSLYELLRDTEVPALT